MSAKEGPFRVLLVEDNPGDAYLIAETLAEVTTAVFRLEHADRLDACMRRLGGERFDAVLLDLGLPDSQGLATLAAVAAAAAAAPILVLTGLDDELLALKAVKAGACDYLVKGQVFGTMLGRAVRHAIERERSARALRESEERFRQLAERIPQAFWLADAALTEVLYVSPAFEAITGLDAAAVYADPRAFLDLVHPDGRGAAADEWDREFRVVRPDGEVRWVRDRGRAVRSGAGEAFRLAGLMEDVTRAREAHRQIRFQAGLLDAVGESLIATRPDGTIFYWNAAAERLYGWSAAEVMGRNIVDVTVPAMAVEQAAAVMASLAAGSRWSGEFPVRRRDGTVFPAFVTDAPITDEAGELVGIIGVSADLSEQKHASEQLRRSEEQLTRILETVADGIVIVDRDGRVTFANRAAEALLGLGRPATPGLAFGEPGWRITAVDGGPLPPDELPAARVLATGAPVFGVEHALERPDGRVVLSVNAAPLRSATGEVEGVVASVRDVTAANQAADQLRFQATLLDAVGELVAATDPGGTLTYWNRHAERLTGWSAEEAAGRSVLDLAATGRSAGDLTVLLGRVARREPWSGEMELARRDGSTFPAFVSGAPILGRAGEVVGVVGAASDLTEVKRLEQQLQQAQRMEAVGRLAGGVAHDFNNLLTGIRGYASLVMDELPAGDPLRADVEEIVKASERAAALTRQLLAFSRKQVLQPRVLDLGAVVGGMERMLARLIGEDVALEFSREPGLGRVRADPGQVEQVLLNLAVNARDAMPGGGTLRVELRNAGHPTLGSCVLLRVADTGTGIAGDVLPHVFEPFFTTKEVGRGTGLGLSTVYGIVAQSGGRVEVRSEPGAGTTFEIALPRVEPEAEEDPRASAVPRAARGETILYVEDEDAVRALGTRTLRRLGYTVLETRDGEEALRASERHGGAIDLLLTDVVMPRMGGRELADELAGRHPGMRVLYVSGYTADVVARHGVVEDGRGFLEKPFSPALLAERVREALDLVLETA
jgi:PAS domain S-box-containing protein